MKRMLGGEGPTKLSRELAVPRQMLHEWRNEYQQGGSRLWKRAQGRDLSGGGGSKAPTPPGSVLVAPVEVSPLAELERKVGRQQLVIDFLQEALHKAEGGRAPTKSSGETGSIPTSER